MEPGLDLDGGVDALGGQDHGRGALDESGRAAAVVDQHVGLAAGLARRGDDLAGRDGVVVGQVVGEEVADDGLAARALVGGVPPAGLELVEPRLEPAAQRAPARPEVHRRRLLRAAGPWLGLAPGLGGLGAAAGGIGVERADVGADLAEGHPLLPTVPLPEPRVQEHDGEVGGDGAGVDRPAELAVEEDGDAVGLGARAGQRAGRRAVPGAVGHEGEQAVELGGGEGLGLVAVPSPAGLDAAQDGQAAVGVAAPPEVARLPAQGRLVDPLARALGHRSPPIRGASVPAPL